MKPGDVILRNQNPTAIKHMIGSALTLAVNGTMLSILACCFWQLSFPRLTFAGQFQGITGFLIRWGFLPNTIQSTNGTL